jgi:hypothetical protein
LEAAGGVSTEELEAMAGLTMACKKRMAAEEMNRQKHQDELNNQQRKDAMLRHEYQEVCANYRAIDDFRGKLLTLWPILGGAAGGVALLASSPANKRYLWAVGLLGLAVSLGLAVYEWNQTLRCDQLKKVGRQLEREMGLETAQFLTLPSGFRRGIKAPPIAMLKQIVEREEQQENRKALDLPERNLIREYPVRVGLASAIVYGSVILGWIGLCVFGLVNLA